MSQQGTEYVPLHDLRFLRSRAQEIADEVIRERVIRGIEVLHEKHGPDWADHIDTVILDLGSGSNCVVGQVFGKWDRGLDILELEGAPWTYGFDSYGHMSYGVLDDAWRTVLGVTE